MTEPSKEARELLAAEFDAQASENYAKGYHNAAQNVRDHAKRIREGKSDIEAIRAIDKALSRPAPDGDEVEVVARAMHERRLAPGKVPEKWPGGVHFTERDYCRDLAHAALSALPSRDVRKEAMEEGLVGRLEAMRDFLNGERALDGAWFGDDPAPGFKDARFWWRKPMKRDLDAAIRALADKEG